MDVHVIITELRRAAGEACFRLPVSRMSLKLELFMSRCSPLLRVRVLFSPSSSGKYCSQLWSRELLSMHSQVTVCVAYRIYST